MSKNERISPTHLTHIAHVFLGRQLGRHKPDSILDSQEDDSKNNKLVVVGMEETESVGEALIKGHSKVE